MWCNTGVKVELVGHTREGFHFLEPFDCDLGNGEWGVQLGKEKT